MSRLFGKLTSGATRLFGKIKEQAPSFLGKINHGIQQAGHFVANASSLGKQVLDGINSTPLGIALAPELSIGNSLLEGLNKGGRILSHANDITNVNSYQKGGIAHNISNALEKADKIKAEVKDPVKFV